MTTEESSDAIDKWFNQKRFLNAPYQFVDEIIRDEESNSITKRVVGFDVINEGKDLHNDIISPFLSQQAEISKSDYPEYRISKIILTTNKITPKDTPTKEYVCIICSVVMIKGYNGVFIYELNHRVYMHSGVDMRLICVINDWNDNEKQQFKFMIPDL
jgi:hypothetical protein